MTKLEQNTSYSDFFEYNGGTEIVRIRTKNGKTIWRDWIIFDSVDEAMEHFNTRCGDNMVPGEK
jgi:hypothetical protein